MESITFQILYNFSLAFLSGFIFVLKIFYKSNNVLKNCVKKFLYLLKIFYKFIYLLKIFYKYKGGGPILSYFRRDFNVQTILILNLIGGGPVHPVGQMHQGHIKIRLKLLWTRLPRFNFGKNIFSNNLVNSAYEVWKAVYGRVKRPALVAKGPVQKTRLMEFLNQV